MEKKQLKTKRKAQNLSPTDFAKQIEKFLICENIAEFPVKKEDFVTEEKSAEIIRNLIKTDQVNRKKLLRSSAYQGYGFTVIHKACQQKKKLFMEKLKMFGIEYHISHVYFLIKLSSLILDHELFINSAIPLRFLRKHFKEFENYVGSLNHPAIQIEEMEISTPLSPEAQMSTGLSQELSSFSLSQ